MATPSGTFQDAAATGALVFDEGGHRIDGTMTETAFAESPLAKSAAMRYTGDETRATLRRQTVYGQLFEITLRFQHNALKQVDFFAILGNEGKSWDDWTMEAEMQRKSAHEAWATRVFGKPMEVKPYFTPNRVMPFEVKPETPRYAQFAWGQVVSGYDSKGGMAWMGVLYGAKDPA